MTSDPSLHAIVLAAGASTRFGSPKQLVRINGRPLLHAVVSRAVAVAGHSVSVVLGANANQLAGLLGHSGAAVIINREWQEGIASSLRAALSQVPGSADGVLILLADQPAISAEDLRRLVQQWRRHPEGLVASQYAQSIGVPAIFPRWCLRELSELRGDRGAQLVLLRHLSRVTRMALPNAALDIDTPEDLLALEAAKILPDGQTP